MRTVEEIQMIERLWKVADVAHYLGKSKSWVYQKTAAGELPLLRIGHDVRFEPQAIQAYARGEWEPANVVPLRQAK